MIWNRRTQIYCGSHNVQFSDCIQVLTAVHHISAHIIQENMGQVVRKAQIRWQLHLQNSLRAYLSANLCLVC